MPLSHLPSDIAATFRSLHREIEVVLVAGVGLERSHLVCRSPVISARRRNDDVVGIVAGAVDEPPETLTDPANCRQRMQRVFLGEFRVNHSTDHVSTEPHDDSVDIG